MEVVDEVLPDIEVFPRRRDIVESVEDDARRTRIVVKFHFSPAVNLDAFEVAFPPGGDLEMSHQPIWIAVLLDGEPDFPTALFLLDLKRRCQIGQPLTLEPLADEGAERESAHLIGDGNEIRG